MFERGISVNDIRIVLTKGERIEEYDNDLPYPSYLQLGFIGQRALHIVAADNKDDMQTIIITAYEPDTIKWQAGFRRRK